MSPMFRDATRRDLPEILRLVRRLAEFEGLTPPDAAARARYVRHGFGPRPYFRAIIAQSGARTAGYAFYFFTYSTFLARPTLYLEDIFILPEFRGRGLGEEMMRGLARIARRAGCGRMEWAVLDWNARAVRFYKRLGARPMKEWILCRLDAAGVIKLARPSRPPPPRSRTARAKKAH